jgi:hypothetical protein
MFSLTWVGNKHAAPGVKLMVGHITDQTSTVTSKPFVIDIPQHYIGQLDSTFPSRCIKNSVQHEGRKYKHELDIRKTNSIYSIIATECRSPPRVPTSQHGKAIRHATSAVRRDGRRAKKFKLPRLHWHQKSKLLAKPNYFLSRKFGVAFSARVKRSFKTQECEWLYLTGFQH